MRKLLFILIPVLLIFVLSCAKKDLSPYAGETDNSSANVSYSVITLDVSGDIISDNLSVAYDKDSSSSWITIVFSGNMDGGAADVHVYNYTTSGIGSEVDYTKDWQYGTYESVLLMKPQDNLNANANYILKINANGTYDKYGKKLDKDGDGIGGETPDDDYIYYFVTQKSDGSDGDPIPWIEDDLNPITTSGVRFTDGTSAPISIGYFDYSVCIRVEDRSYDNNGVMTYVDIDGSTVNENTVKVLEPYTLKEVSGTVTYITDNTSPLYRYIIFTPTEGHFRPNTQWYVLRLYGGIADSHGNKLYNTSEYNDYYFNTRITDHNGDTLEGDYRPPYIDDYDTDGVFGRIIFSEQIDHSTIGEPTIYATSPSVRLNYQVGEVLNGSKYVTVVTVTRQDGGNIAGTTVQITGAIKDLAGNYKGSIDTHTF